MSKYTDKQIGALVDAVPDELSEIPTPRGTLLLLGGERLFNLFRWCADNLPTSADPAPASGEQRADVCECADWEPETRKIDAQITLPQLRNPASIRSKEFAFKAWHYCPWCGGIARTHTAARRTREGERDNG